MKVAVIGDFAGHADEGLKVASKRVAQLAGGFAEVQTIDLRVVPRFSTLRSLRRAAPDVVHVVAGPSPRASVVMHAIRLAAPRARRVLTAMHPLEFPRFWSLSRGARPHIVLAQSRASREAVEDASGRALHMPVSVDLQRFAPLAPAAREARRAELGWGKEERILLHVGHLKPGRGLDRLTQAQKRGWRVVVVASTSTKASPLVADELRKGGVTILEGYLPRIEEVYASADAYAFPTASAGDAVETPLSVLEAMACNLSVAATVYPGLPDLFPPGQGLEFIGPGEDLGDTVARATSGAVTTRKTLEAATMLHRPDDLRKIYREALEGA